jgi:ABC-type uncharacterized transport system fused permease/ATPase subunit
MRFYGHSLRWLLPVLLILSTATQIAAQNTKQPPTGDTAKLIKQAESADAKSQFIDTAQILADLHAQRDRINNAISALEALNGTAVPQHAAKPATKAEKPVAMKSVKTAPVAPPATTKRVISTESRQRMADAQQMRWAKKKKVAKAAAKATASAA